MWWRHRERIRFKGSGVRLLRMQGDKDMKKTAYMGLFAAAAIIFGYVETLLPVFAGIPGIKLGLANLVTVILLYLFGWREAAVVSFIRILVIGFMFGNLFSILFSLAGAGLSLLVMVLLKKNGGFSVAGVSIAGGDTQYRTDSDRSLRGGECESFLLSSCTSHSRASDRTADWYSVR